MVFGIGHGSAIRRWLDSEFSGQGCWSPGLVGNPFVKAPDKLLIADQRLVPSQPQTGIRLLVDKAFCLLDLGQVGLPTDFCILDVCHRLSPKMCSALFVPNHLSSIQQKLAGHLPRLPIIGSTLVVPGSP